MTSELPPPNSLWRTADTGEILQVVIVNETEIVCHNCSDPRAMASDRPFSLKGWSGTPEEFWEDFEPL